MNVTSEIDVLKIVVDALGSLEPEARKRVMNYAASALNIAPVEPPQQRLLAVEKGKGALGSIEKPASPQEYLRRYNYKIMTKRIAVIAVFLERERAKRRFSLREITEAFKDAKEAKPPAHSQYARAVAMNYLARDGEQFYATSQAEILVDSYVSQQKAVNEEE